ncbi:MAG: ferrichrome-iron receptor [Nitrospirales bacterium]|nr:MAG: ferrichrome-iron receptor [Nitrospirales bacterium]
MAWGIMVGLSSLAVGTYHPALAKEGKSLPSRHSRQQDPELSIGGRHHPMSAARQEEGEPARLSLTIPAGALQPALLALSEQGRVQLLYPSDLVTGRETQGLEGLYTSEEALQRLLQCTGLQYRFSDVDTITLFAQDDTGAAGVAGIAGAAAGAGTTQKSDAPVVQVEPVEVTDTITRPTGFLPPVDGYKADQTTSSTRTALPINETPTSIGVVTRDVIKDTFSRSQSEAFEHVSGVTRRNTTRLGRSEQFSIRGFGSNNRFGSLGALRSNGLPVGMAFAPDPALIERYEIIKGPASIAGGASSPGGLVNRVTKSPQDENFATSDFQTGSFDFYRGVIDANGVLPQHKNVRGRFIFAVEEGGHFVDDIDVRQYTIAPSVEIDLFDGTGILLLTGHYQKFDGSNYKGIPLLANVEIPDIPRTHNISGGTSNGADLDFDGQNYEAHYVHDFVNNLKLSMKGKYSLSDQVDRTLYAYPSPELPPSGDMPIYSGLQRNEWETYAGEIFLSHEFEALGQKHEVLVGVDHRDHKVDIFAASEYVGINNIFNPVNTFNVLPDDSLFAFNNRQIDFKQTGVFAQVVARPLPRLTLVGALRQDWAETTAEDFRRDRTSKGDDSELTGRVGAIYELFPGIRIYGGFAQSFIVNFFGVQADGSLLPPETGENYEVGAKIDLLDGRVRLTTAVFRNYRQNIQAADLGNPGFSRAVGEQRHQGVELDINGQPWPGLNLLGQFSIIDAKVTDDNDGFYEGSHPVGIPRSYVGKVFATYELQSGPLQGFGFGGGVFFQSGFVLETFDAPPFPSTDDYERVDAVVFYRPPRKAYEFTINVRNLLDATYIESGGFANAFNQFGAPVSVFGTLRVKFDPDFEWTPPWAD